MAKINVKKAVYEDFTIGPGKPKRVGAFSGHGGYKGSFFTKGAKDNHASKSWNQKSIAKVSYMKNSYKGQWGVHGRYLARQGAQLQDAPGLGFDAENNDLNISKTLRAWQEEGDPRLWKIIISPERAYKLDLKEHVRAVMRHVEEDFGTKLEWVAIDHYNTDNFHTHIVLRGVDRQKNELRISQRYFTQGFRQRSVEEVTRALGFRLEQDVLEQRDLNLRAMHITEMDREIERKLNEDRFITLSLPHDAFLFGKELQLKSRLMFLEEMGLAKAHSNATWHVDAGFLDYLKFIQTQQDIIKTKNRHIDNILNSSLSVVVSKLEGVGETLVGRIVGMGLSEGQNEPRYMLIEGIDNKIHYVLPNVGILKKRDGGDLRNGEIIYLQRREFFKAQEAQEPLHIKYLFAECFQSFKNMGQSQQITHADMFIFGQFFENQKIPTVEASDGLVRKQFLGIMEQRIGLMRRIGVIRPDYSINEGKLAWIVDRHLTLDQGQGLNMGGLTI